jgi:hypothetical protein
VWPSERPYGQDLVTPFRIKYGKGKPLKVFTRNIVERIGSQSLNQVTKVNFTSGKLCGYHVPQT